MKRGEVAFTDSDLGAVNYNSIPRAVWHAIPELFPELLPEGWRGVGLLQREEDPHGPPVGWVSRTVLGVELYASNCSLCHTGAFQGKVVVGAPNSDLDIQYLVWVIGEALRSPTLTLEAVEKISREQGRPLEGLERQGVRAWLALAHASMNAKPRKPFTGLAGAGRSDNLNGFKRLFDLPEDRPAFVDLVPVFNQHLKNRSLIDGSMTGDHTARVMLSELQKGRPGRDALLHREVFDDIVAYIEGPLTAPKYPFAVDGKRAERGHQVFVDSCSHCHGTYAPDAETYPNLRVSVEKVGTDPERARAMSPDIAAALNTSEFAQYLSIEASDSYMPPRLGGLWVTAPYLHNGSVPTLWHLLHPKQRPVSFFRRWNDFDPEHVGLACPERRSGGEIACGPDASQQTHDPRTVSLFDTRARGNGNGGHLFGSRLPEDDKLALIEYLKTI